MDSKTAFKKLRQRLGLNQTEMAEVLNIHRISWHRYEAGKRFISYEIAKRLESLCKKNGIKFELYFGDKE